MRGAIPPLPNKPSWCGAQLKTTDTTSPLPSFSSSVSRTCGWTRHLYYAFSSCTLYEEHITSVLDRNALLMEEQTEECLCCEILVFLLYFFKIPL